MFTLRECSAIRNLVDPDIAAKDILTDDEKEILVNKNLICDDLIVTKSRRTMMLKKIVMFDSFDLLTLVKEINLVVKGPYEIRIGFSFIAQTKKSRNIYFFSIRARCLNQETRMIRTKRHYDNLCNYLEPLSYNDILQKVFDINNTLHPFEESGYRPKKLITCSIWLTKY